MLKIGSTKVVPMIDLRLHCVMLRYIIGDTLHTCIVYVHSHVVSTPLSIQHCVVLFTQSHSKAVNTLDCLEIVTLQGIYHLLLNYCVVQ